MKNRLLLENYRGICVMRWRLPCVFLVVLLVFSWISPAFASELRAEPAMEVIAAIENGIENAINEKTGCQFSNAELYVGGENSGI